MVVASTTVENLERRAGTDRQVVRDREPVGAPRGVEDATVGISARTATARSAAIVPACRLEDLGDASFRADHGLRYALHVGGDGQRDRLGRDRRGDGAERVPGDLRRGGAAAGGGRAGDRPDSARAWAIRFLTAMNLIHSPGEPELEAAVVDLYLRRRVRLVEASAFLNLTLPVVRYRVAGLRRDGRGGSWRRTGSSPRSRGSRSRPSSWRRRRRRFLRELVAAGEITPEQAEWAARIPMADDITAEADSGGHTDNQPAIVLLPTMLALRDRMQAQHGYDRPLRVGAAGGISTPWAAAAALAMGAAYLVTGSVNQSCVEAGTSDAVRRMLAQAQQADIAMAPAADMFEMGVKVQVLKRGTLFAMRAAKLYELYRAHDGPRPDPRRRAGEPREDDLPRAARNDLGADAGLLSSSATRRGSSGRSAIPSRRWRWCSAGIWGCRRTGPTAASRRGPSTTRSGAARRWPPSTTGCAARSWSRPRIAGWRRSP